MKQAARWIAISALFVIPFLPLYVPNDLFFPFITGKNFAFRILVEIAAAAYLVLALLDARYRPRFSWTLVVFGLFTACMAIANFLGVHPHKAFWSNFERMDGWVTLVHLFILFVVAGAVLSVEKFWRSWWLTFVGAAALVSVYGLAQLGGGAEIHQGGIRLTATLGNAIYLAVYLLFALFASAWLAVSSQGWMRVALLAFMPLGAVILFFTGSRGPLLGLAAGIVVAAILWLAYSFNDLKKGVVDFGSKIAIGFLAALLVVGGVLFMVRDTAFVQESVMLSRAASVFSLGDALSVRSTIWEVALEGVKENPVTGVGQEGFNQVFNKHYRPELYEQEMWFDRVHNLYLDWLIAGGIPALVLFLALFGAAVVALVRTTAWSRGERVLLLAALAAYAVQALVVFDNLFSYVPFAMILAMAHMASARSIPAVQEAPEMQDNTAQMTAAAAAGIVVLGLLWFVHIPAIRSAHNLVYAVSLKPEQASESLKRFETALALRSPMTQEIREQMVLMNTSVQSNAQVSEEVKKRFAERALAEMQKENELSPNDARLRLQLASAYSAAGDQEQSLKELERALTLSPQKQGILITVATKLQQLGRLEEARVYMRNAYELDTSFPKLGVAIGTGLILAGDTAGGKEILMQAVGTTTPPDEALLYAYYQTKQWDDFIAVVRAQAEADNNSPQSRYRYAQALAVAGRVTAARAEVLAIIRAFPQTADEGNAMLETLRAGR